MKSKKYSLSFNPPSITKQMSELAAMAASTLGWQWQPPSGNLALDQKLGKLSWNSECLSDITNMASTLSLLVKLSSEWFHFQLQQNGVLINPP